MKAKGAWGDATTGQGMPRNASKPRAGGDA